MIAGAPVVQVTNSGTSKELNIRFKDKARNLLMTREEFENRRVPSSTGTVYATIAPYYNTRITDSNKKEITEKVRKVFLSKAKQVAKDLGISIKSVSNNIGGFTFQEGETI